MQVTIKDSKEVWKSPDGQRVIYDITDAEGNTWSTMSRQIAQSIDQTLELTTRVSSKGKTYLVKPQDGQYAPQTPSSQQPLPGTTSDVERFTRAVERFEKAVAAWELRMGPSLPDRESQEIVDDI